MKASVTANAETKTLDVKLVWDDETDETLLALAEYGAPTWSRDVDGNLTCEIPLKHS